MKIRTMSAGYLVSRLGSRNSLIMLIAETDTCIIGSNEPGLFGMCRIIEIQACRRCRHAEYVCNVERPEIIMDAGNV